MSASPRIPTDRQIERTIERVAYGLAEAAEAVGVGETTMRELLATGEIPSFRLRRRRLIRRSDLSSFVDRMFDLQHGEGGATDGAR